MNHELRPQYNSQSTSGVLRRPLDCSHQPASWTLSGHWQAGNSHSAVTAYEDATGWVLNKSGDWEYIVLGTIEEVDCGNIYPVQLGVGLQLPGSNITDSLPVDTIPPPRPRQRETILLPPCIADQLQDTATKPQTANEMSMQILDPRTKSPGLLPTTIVSVSLEPMLQSQKEDVALNRSFVESTLFGIHRMCSYFLSICQRQDVRHHINACSRLEVLLHELDRTLQRSYVIQKEQWECGSFSWHQKYFERLTSLRTSLLNLCSMGRSRPATGRLDMFLDELLAHEDTISQVDRKLNAGFDRLRICQLHAVLSDERHGAYRHSITDMKVAELPMQQTEQSRTCKGIMSDPTIYRTGRRGSTTL